ncbi:hypothetical protein THASP1DRAFT_28520 [Thamnocephalis sphaerospora]|uniref:Uncharacterized protein n=1 Tax=Thamnocephalis sphaerospora TaxID=78915 RepID=A0A4P9XVQ2_9FUNG|nr:hypothetical protein THASP1DRAFT_28520 [Thamnocephalis sphaerospora]|eukprot:RKP09691.1 hypothetical protein THASP1DRAFT_28520 [Thamnocephalis sphaerospora]
MAATSSNAGRAARPIPPLTDRLLHMVMHLQFAWWIGHVSVVMNTALFYLCYFTNYDDIALPAYYTALLSAVLSYAVAGYKSMGKPQLNMAYAAQLSSNDSVQYLILALIWYSQPAMIVTLVPFAIFAGLHSLTYFNNTLVPALMPSAVNATDANRPWLARMSGRAEHLARQHYVTAMNFVARWEAAVILAWVLLQTILFQISFFTPMFYSTFLRNRYAVSSYHQDAFRNMRVLLDRQLVENPGTNAGLRKLYVTLRDFVSSLAVPQYAAQPQQAGAAR